MNKLIEPIYDLLKTRDSWVQGKFAANSDGIEVGFSDASATCWCLSGALHKIYFGHNDLILVKRLIEKQTGASIVLYNDHSKTTYQDVLDMLKAIP